MSLNATLMVLSHYRGLLGKFVRAGEFITEHQPVWRDTDDGPRLRWRCTSGPRKNKIVPSPMHCSLGRDNARTHGHAKKPHSHDTKKSHAQHHAKKNRRKTAK